MKHLFLWFLKCISKSVFNATLSFVFNPFWIIISLCLKLLTSQCLSYYGHKLLEMCKPSAAADVVAVTAGLLLVDPFVSLSRSSHDGCGPPGFGSGLGLGGWSTGCHIFTWFWKSHIILTDSYGCRSIQVAVMIMRMMIIMVMMMTRLMTFCTKNVFWSLHKGLFTWHIVISLAVSEPCGLSPWSSADLCQNDDHDIVTMTVWPVGEFRGSTDPSVGLSNTVP